MSNSSGHFLLPSRHSYFSDPFISHTYMTSSRLLKSSTLPFLSPLSVDNFYFSEETDNQQRTSTTTSATNWHLCPHTCFCSCCMEDLCALQSQCPSSPANELGSGPFCLLKGSTAAILWLSLLCHPSISPSLLDNSISTQTWGNFSHLKTRKEPCTTQIFCQLFLNFP